MADEDERTTASSAIDGEVVTPDAVPGSSGQETAQAEVLPPQVVPRSPTRDGLRVSVSLAETIHQFPSSIGATVKMLLEFGTGRLEEDNQELKRERATLTTEVKGLGARLATESTRSAVLSERIRQLKIARRLHDILQTLGGIVIGAGISEVNSTGLTRSSVMTVLVGAFLVVIAYWFTPAATEKVDA